MFFFPFRSSLFRRKKCLEEREIARNKETRNKEIALAQPLATHNRAILRMVSWIFYFHFHDMLLCFIIFHYVYDVTLCL